MDKDLNANGDVKYTIIPNSMKSILEGKIHLNDSNGNIVLRSVPENFDKGVFQFLFELLTQANPHYIVMFQYLSK